VASIALARLHDPAGSPIRTSPVHAIREAHRAVAFLQAVGILPRDPYGTTVADADRDAYGGDGSAAGGGWPIDGPARSLAYGAAFTALGRDGAVPLQAGTVMANDGTVLDLPAASGARSVPKTRFVAFDRPHALILGRGGIWPPAMSVVSALAAAESVNPHGPGVVVGEDREGGTVGPLSRVLRRVFDLGVGRYDLTVRAGPSFASRREEAASQMIELIRAFPPAAPLIGDLLAKNLDWPGADEVARRLARATGGG
jgi:hypothetical protein